MAKIKKNLEKIINKAVLESFSGDNINEKKVWGFVKAFKSLSKPNAILSMTYYLKGLKTYLKQHTLTIESSSILGSEDVDRVKEAILRKYKILDIQLKTNPSLAGGLKVKIGDNVYDDTVSAKINQVKEAIVA